MTDVAPSDLEQLLAVQALDTTADQLEHRLANLPERASLRTAQDALRTVEASLAELGERLDALVASQEQLEQEITNLDSRAAQVSRALATGTVPRELHALQEELDGITARKRLVEDRELELMEEAEPLEKERDELLSARARHDADTLDLTAAIAEAEVTIDAELRAARAEREKAAASVPAALLGEYEPLRQRLGGIGAARLVGGMCGGCHLTLPAVEVDRIRHLADGTLVHCDECGRVLVP
jgi:predicted  nucleic acid-binding Zn-ribbon protein